MHRMAKKRCHTPQIIAVSQNYKALHFILVAAYMKLFVFNGGLTSISKRVNTKIPLLFGE